MKDTKKGGVIKRTFKIAAQGERLLFVSCVASIIGTLAGGIPYVSVYFIARQLLAPVSGSNTPEVLFFWVLVAGVSILLKMVLSFLGSYGCHRVAFRLLYNFRVKVMEHIGRLSIGFFADNTTGSVQKTMDDNIEKIEGFVAHMLPDIWGSAFMLVALLTGLFILNGWLALAVILSIVLALALQMTVFGGEKVKKLWADVSIAAASMTGAFSEYVKGIAEVKLFGLTGTITRSLNENIDNYRTWELRNYKRSAVPMSLYKTIVLSMLAFVLPVGILLISSSPEAGTLLAVLMALILTPAIYDPLMTCVNYGSQMGMLAVGLDAIDAILDREPVPAPQTPQVPASWDISFKNVSFSYQDKDAAARVMALDGISFTALQGQTTALVGPSGGGKSTIAQLISRFWDVESGSITIGGIDLRNIEPTRLMNSIATVFQDTYIFADTIRGNITMNRPYDKATVEAAAKAAQCHDFIMALPNGYETRIGTGGASLSGGEAQRLSIARAILKGSPIIILDEALAYSDAENENLIQQAIKNLVKGKTVLIIAHRLHSVCNAEQILLVKQGQIHERGTHEELKSKESEYKTLWNLQHEADAWTISAEPGAATAEVMA